MTIKWTEKDVLEYAKMLKSPFEEAMNPQPAQGNSNRRELMDRLLKAARGKGRGLLPQQGLPQSLNKGGMLPSAPKI